MTASVFCFPSRTLAFADCRTVPLWTRNIPQFAAAGSSFASFSHISIDGDSFFFMLGSPSFSVPVCQYTPTGRKSQDRICPASFSPHRNRRSGQVFLNTLWLSDVFLRKWQKYHCTVIAEPFGSDLPWTKKKKILSVLFSLYWPEFSGAAWAFLSAD